MPFQTILILEWFYVGMKVLAWCIDLNGIENKNTAKYSYPYLAKKYEVLIADIQIISQKVDTGPTPFKPVESAFNDPDTHIYIVWYTVIVLMSLSQGSCTWELDNWSCNG